MWKNIGVKANPGTTSKGSQTNIPIGMRVIVTSTLVSSRLIDELTNKPGKLVELLGKVPITQHFYLTIDGVKSLNIIN